MTPAPPHQPQGGNQETATVKRPNTQHSARAHNPNATPAPRVPRAGFTLPELLIAITVFLSVAGGIALLFTQSIRTVKVGHQNIEVNEHIRAAMDLLETDLTQAFTSRDYGDYYTFYGTPIGMTFVGLVRPNRDNAQPNLSRITYVLYTQDPRAFTSYEDYAAIMPNNQPITYTLLRYVEPDRDSLESMPLPPPYNELPWPDPAQPPPTFEGPEYAQIHDELQEVYLNLAEDGDPNFFGAAGILCEGNDLSCRNELVRAKKREIWIRMLAGDPRLPAFWREDYLRRTGTDNPDFPSYQDYILAEDIVLINPNANPEFFKEDIKQPGTTVAFDRWFEYWTTQSAIPRDPGAQEYRPLFQYGSCCQNDGQPAFYEFWNDHRNMVGLAARDVNVSEANRIIALGSPLAPRIPMIVDINLSFLQQSPYAGAPDLFRSFTKQIDIPTGYTRTDLTS